MLCCVFSFFLFKEKTAYEMRISDWSSDVCSSDLGADEQDTAGPERLLESLDQVGLYRALEVDHDVPADDEVEGAVERIAEQVQLLEPGAGQQQRARAIGRASSRDRVWSYG